MWACVFILAFGNAFYLSVDAYKHYKKSPVTLSFLPYELPLSVIPFSTINFSQFNTLKTDVNAAIDYENDFTIPF
jgi:hypothetical protein